MHRVFPLLPPQKGILVGVKKTAQEHAVSGIGLHSKTRQHLEAGV